MKTLQLRDAKATLSAVINAAQEGAPTTITRHGKPLAVVVSHDEWLRLNPEAKPDLVQHLLSMPDYEPEVFQRWPDQLRDVDL
jgi:antitoxin Phd